MPRSIQEAIYFYLPSFLQSSLISAYGAKLYKKRYADPFNKLLTEIESLEQSTKREIREFKFLRLRSLLIHAQEHVPYYSDLFKKLGLDVKKFQDFNDLRNIPILEKETIRKEPHLFISTRPSDIGFQLQHTSGSTGKPLSLYVDERTYKRAMALVVHHEQINGVPFGSRRATFAGRMIQKIENQKPPFCRYNRAENQMLFSAYHLSQKTISWYIKDLNIFKPTEIIGYPSAIYDLAYFISQSDEKLTFTPKLIVTNSETLFDWQRKFIEQELSAPIRDYYGTAEYVVFAGECVKRKYHISPSLGLIEIVDDKNNSVTDEEGDLICTTLSNFSMPLIRYRVGDRAKLSSKPCTCGRHTEILHNITGRIDDYIISLDNRKIGRLDHIYKGLKNIKESQIVQVSNDLCSIKLVKADNLTSIDESTLRQNFAERVGSDMHVYIEYLDKIPKGKNGKFRAVINHTQNKL